MSPPSKRKAGKLRSWRSQFIGVVTAADERTAEAAAVAQFDLSEEQRKRLIVQEQQQ